MTFETPPWHRWFDYGVKALLFGSFAVALLFPPDVIAGKGIPARAPLFLAPAILVPILARVKGWEPYPYLADGLASLPFLLDTLGNLGGFYDRYDATDDVLHFTNWVFLVMAFHAFRYRNIGDNRDAVFLGIGFGAFMIVIWEAFEWLISTDGPLGGAAQDTLSLTYGDTVGDLVISTSGGVVGSLIGRYWISNNVARPSS